MWARSSRRDALALIALTTACGKHARNPDLDPARIQDHARRVAHNLPAPAAVPACKPNELAGGATLSFRTLLELAGDPIASTPEHADWINPPALDVPAARLLIDPAADAAAKRQAAAELEAAPFWVVYHVELVDAPLALGVKELKLGTVGTMVLRFDRAGLPTCMLPFYFQNTKEKNDWAIAKSDRPVVDPAVAQALREDLAAQFVKLAPGRAPAPPTR
jgi:hypothetical protein